MLERLNGLWFGERLGYLEQLSIATAMAQGHPYTLYSYTPHAVSGVPAGVELRDAREVMNDQRRTKHFEGKFKALGSDFFRYELLAKGLGYWVDLDLIFLKPLSLTQDYVFGWERPGSLNGAVLKIPTGSAMLEEMRTIPEKNWCPPFFGPKRRLLYYLERLRKDVELEDLPWGAAGPGLITYLAKRDGHAAQAQPIPVFYPLPYDRARMLYEAPAEEVEALCAPETIAIHMWHSSLKELPDSSPPEGSYIHRLCEAHNIDTERAS